MASDIEGEKDMRELVLGATYQMSRLTTIVNDSLTVPEDDEPDVTEEPVSPPPGEYKMSDQGAHTSIKGFKAAANNNFRYTVTPP